MICLILIMTLIFVNGIENAEQKVKHSDTMLREEEMDAKMKAWLLMVESGKVDEEEFRRITPKSIFIAPLLTGQTEKCKEGYRHDHLGRCVKVIKIDPKVQLELLLKRLSSIYGDKKQGEEEGEDEDRPAQISSGPLHFSIPISSEEEKKKNSDSNKPESEPSVSFSDKLSSAISPPVSLPIWKLNETNQTQEVESSGAGPFNDTESYVSHIEGSGFSPLEEGWTEETTTYSINLLPEDTDYLDSAKSERTESTTEIFSTTEIMSTTTEAPESTTDPTESYQSVTEFLSANNGVKDLPTEKVKTHEFFTNKSKSDIILFPSDNEERTNPVPPVDNSYIRFPDDSQQSQKVSNYRSSEPSISWNSPYQILPSAISRQQFWWLPENWKVDDQQQKSSLVKFWSRLPLIQDVGWTNENRNGFKKPSNPPRPQSVNYKRRNADYVVSFNSHSPPSRRGKPFRNNRFFQDFVTTQNQALRNER